MVTITMEVWFSHMVASLDVPYSTTIKILDENENVLDLYIYKSETMTLVIITTLTHILDTITHNDTGVRKWDWEWIKV